LRRPWLITILEIVDFILIMLHTIEAYAVFSFCGLGILTFVAFVCFNSRYWNRHCERLVRVSRRTSMAPVQLARWLSVYARQHQLITGLVQWSNLRLTSDIMLIF